MDPSRERIGGMDQEQVAAGDAAIPGHPNEAVDAGVRSEDQRPRQASGPHSGGVRTTGGTTASAAAARVRRYEDAQDKDFREFDHFVKMHLQKPQQQQPQTQQHRTRLHHQQQQTQQPRTHLQQSPSRSSAESGGEVAPGPASPDLELRL